MPVPDLTVTQLLQLYAPMLGLIGLSFWVGALSQRVKGLEKDGDGHGGLALQFATFQGEMRGKMDAWAHSMEGLRSDLTWLRQAAVYEPEQMRNAFDRNRPGGA